MRFRIAERADVPAIVDLLADDVLGVGRESVSELTPYLAAFDQIQSEDSNLLIVGELEGVIIATYQLTVMSGLSLHATRRAHVEGVRVASSLRGQGVGKRMFDDVEARARALGCGLLQLATNKSRDDAQRFYGRLGYVDSHIGFKKALK
ncbi:MAG: GNAT family N-acetyltransferase [Thalassovita sp.]